MKIEIISHPEDIIEVSKEILDNMKARLTDTSKQPQVDDTTKEWTSL